MYRPRVLDWVYYAGVGLLYVTFVLLDNPFLVIAVLATLGVGTAGVGVGLIGRTLLRRDRASVIFLGVAMSVTLAAMASWRPARDGLAYVAFRSDRATLDEVARLALAEPRVRQVSAGDRYWKYINGIPVKDLDAPTPPGREPPGPPAAVPAAEVLRQEGIAPTTYRAIRAGLRRAGYLDVQVWPGYVLFIEDGMLDNEYGVLLVRPGQGPPHLGPPRPGEGMHFTSMRSLGRGWYAWSST